MSEPVDTLVFDRPACGAVRDVKELEYISLLHRASVGSHNGTIDANSISLLLNSRHGIRVDVKDINEHILKDFARDPKRKNENDQEADQQKNVLDIAQMAALLLLPKLKEVATSGDKGEGCIFQVVLDILKNDIAVQNALRKKETTSVTLEDTNDGLRINKETLRTLFWAYGENEVSDDFLEDMVAHAGEDAPLNKAVLIKALTKDLDPYNNEWDTSPTTHFEDIASIVHGQKKLVAGVPQVNEIDDDVSSDVEATVPRTKPIIMKQVGNLAAQSEIDLTADTFENDYYFSLLFFTFSIYSFFYEVTWFEFIRIQDCPNSETQIGCYILSGIINWMNSMIIFGLVGSISIYMMSAGNSMLYRASVWSNAIALLVIMFSFIAPYWFATDFGFSENPNQPAAVVGLVLACVLIVFQIGSVFKHVSKGARTLLSTSLRKEKYTKSSTLYKVNNFLKHALEMQPTEVGEGGHTTSLLNYQSRLNDVETVGGMVWSFANMKDFCVKEGVWYSTRIISGHLSQFLGILLFALAIYESFRYVEETFGSSTTDLATSKISLIDFDGMKRGLYHNASGSYLFQQNQVTDEFLTMHNLSFAYAFDEDVFFYQESKKEKLVRSVINAVSTFGDASIMLGVYNATSLAETLGDIVYNYTGIDPETILQGVIVYSQSEKSTLEFFFDELKKTVALNEIRPALITGAVMGSFIVFYNTAVYLPSYACQTLQYRYGCKFSAMNPGEIYEIYQAKWWPQYLLGTVAFSNLLSGLLTCLIFTITVFFLLWSQTAETARYALGWLIGLIVTLLIRQLLELILLRKAFQGFYRKNLTIGNSVGLFFECWSVPLGLGMFANRIFKIIVLSCLFLGRADTKLIARSASYPALVDVTDLPFQVDILVHEAHRHPYIERLCLLYLLKLYHGRNFASRAGSSWRLLFVLALMPWLRGYRAKEIDSDAEGSISQGLRPEVVVEENN